jgi:integrase
MEQEGRIDIHDRQRQYELALKNFNEDKEILSQNKEFILNFLKDCEAGKTLRNRQKKKISIGRLTRIVELLKRFAKWFNKPFNELTQKDLESVMTNLEQGVYKKYKANHELGGNFSQSTVVYFKKTFKKFNRWLQENNLNRNLDCGYLETFEITKEIESISKDDVEKMVYRSTSIMKKAILMTLFDGGMRAEELINVRIKHISQRESTYLIRIEFSKTMPRTVILPIASKYLDEWLNSSDAPKDRESQVFPITYDALRAFIIRSGKKAINRHITPHTLRHSSASYYCNNLTQYQLCKRYGWSMASKMPARYIDRQAVMDDEITQKIKSDETTKLTKENDKLKEQMAFMKERMDSFEKMMIEKATIQGSPIHIQTPLGQESYSVSGCQPPGQKFRPVY